MGRIRRNLKERKLWEPSWLWRLMWVSLGALVAWGVVLAVANAFGRFPTWFPFLGMGVVAWMLMVHAHLLLPSLEAFHPKFLSADR
jgi:hypothetical protein